jgi:DNA-3-methyladenine glycosylase
MARLRKLPADAKPQLLTAGPGRLCQALGITRATHNGIDVTRAASELQVRDDGYRPAAIEATARIGISKAVDRPHRFLVQGNRFVSK